MGVPDPDEVLHIVFEKFWSGSRKLRREIPARMQILLAVDSVLSNLATSSQNTCQSLISPSAGSEVAHHESPRNDIEDDLARPPDRDLSDCEECHRLTELLSSNELDRQVCRFIMGRPETSMRAFKGSVRPRAIARELGVGRQEIYKSFERLRINMLAKEPAVLPYRPLLPGMAARGNKPWRSKMRTSAG